jgi:glycosyltransferase involved in cell wall biosynthesis
MNRPIDDLVSSLGGEPLLPTPPTDPRFSVIVRTQGTRPDSLAGALASLADQTRPPEETVIVVHDREATSGRGLADRVAAELSEPHLRLPSDWKVVSVNGGRRSRPLNTGIDASTGDYLAFLDDDDLAMPSWIEAFARGAADSPGTIVRAVCLTQEWATDGTNQPVRATGALERPFADRFDLLAHLSHNETPICSIAVPRAPLVELGIRFDEDLEVMEDWELLVRLAMLTGVTSILDETSLYRRLDSANAFAAVDQATWHRTHATIIERFRSRPVLLPPGVADRLAAAHFDPDGTTEHERRAEALASSPWWRLTAGPRRLVTALRGARTRRG